METFKSANIGTTAPSTSTNIIIQRLPTLKGACIGTTASPTFNTAIVRRSHSPVCAITSLAIRSMAPINLLTSTKGSSWNKIAKSASGTKRNDNPNVAAISFLLSETNAIVPFSQASGILDNGCGPGAIMLDLLHTYGEIVPECCTLTCSDFSEGMIEQVKLSQEKQVAAGSKTWLRVRTMVTNAMDMAAIPSASLSHVLAGWVYFMTPDPQKCLSESLRMLKLGGVLGLSSWAGSQWIQIMQELTTVFPEREIPPLPETWSSVPAVRQELEKAGFSSIQSKPIEVYMGYNTHREVARFLLHNIPVMVDATRGLSEEELGEVEDVMVKKCKEFNPEEPGRFKGDAIIAVGVKSGGMM